MGKRDMVYRKTILFTTGVCEFKSYTRKSDIVRTKCDGYNMETVPFNCRVCVKNRYERGKITVEYV